MEHTLEFLNPEWHCGDNVTIRLGDKWLKKSFVGQVVNVKRTGLEEILATGIIDEVRLCPFKDVSLHDLWAEHDPDCRTPNGLVNAMLRAYPDFTLDSWVTVIHFVI